MLPRRRCACALSYAPVLRLLYLPRHCCTCCAPAQSFEQKARQAEAQGRGTYDLEEECNEAKAKFEKSLKVAVTLDAIKKKGKGRR